MDFVKTLEAVSACPWQKRTRGLGRTTELMRLLGDPQKELRFVHIAGTNGKGSTAAMLSSVLTQAGYTTGLFTSPHLQRYNERIKVNGADIPDGEMDRLMEEIWRASRQMEEAPSEFEILTAMGLLYFRERGCDIVVLEVGLGGRIDSTNIIPAPEAAVITNIGLEHTEYLGDTLEQIAGEKAGIIKPGTQVVLYHQTPGVEAVVRAQCALCACPLTITDGGQQKLLECGLEGQTFSYREREGLRLSLPGSYQYRNAAVVLDTVDALKERGWSIPEQAVRAGLAGAAWPGRFEVLGREPLVIVDGAHNPNGVEALVQSLKQYLPGRSMTFVMGVMADKNYDQMLELAAPLARRFITVTPESHRALDSGRLAEDAASRFGLPVQDAGTVEAGVSMALAEAGPEDVVCILGSLYQAGAVRGLLKQ